MKVLTFVNKHKVEIIFTDVNHNINMASKYLVYKLQGISEEL